MSRLYGLDAGVATTPVANAIFTVLPNPAHNRVTISREDGSSKAMISVRDIAGREVHRHAIDPLSSYTWDLAAVPSGAYIVTLLEAGRVLDAQRLVVAP